MDIPVWISSLQEKYYGIAPAVNNIVISVLFLLAGFILGKIAGKFISWALKEVNADHYGKKILGISFSPTATLSTLISGAIYVYTLYYTIQMLNITTVILFILLAIIGLFFLLAIIGFVFNIMPNAIAGLKLRSRPELKEGNIVRIDRISGKVTGIGLAFTTILTPDKETVVIPHLLLKKKLSKR